MIVSLSENQLNQVQSYIDTLDASKNKDNYFVGKCGEVAVHNYGLITKTFKNFYGYELFESILNNIHKADLGHDLILQSLTNRYAKVFAQVKTVVCENGRNLLLDQRLYNDKLEYYNGIPQDIFIMVKKLSMSTYDVVGFIEYDDAISVYKKDFPVKGCYNIDEKHLQPIEDIRVLFQ